MRFLAGLWSPPCDEISAPPEPMPSAPPPKETKVAKGHVAHTAPSSSPPEVKKKYRQVQTMPDPVFPETKPIQPPPINEDRDWRNRRKSDN